MNRTLLRSAMEGLVSRCGYHFQVNDEACYPTTVCRYPAAFMSQPKFVRMEGRNHGRITYNITLRFARQGAKLAPQERNSALEEMEQQMMEMFGKLSEREFVVAVEDLQIRHSSMTLTPHGEVATTATAKVITFF
jgi:hypothetical protein